MECVTKQSLKWEPYAHIVFWLIDSFSMAYKPFTGYLKSEYFFFFKIVRLFLVNGFVVHSCFGDGEKVDSCISQEHLSYVLIGSVTQLLNFSCDARN